MIFLKIANHSPRKIIESLINTVSKQVSSYIPKDPANFRAGRLLKNDGDEILLTIGSVDFPESMPSESEFEALLNGDIQILS